MKPVVHVVAAVVVLDVHIVRVAPIDWPWIDESERVPAILKASLIVITVVDVKAVLAAKPAGVVSIRNAAMLAFAPDMRSRWRLPGTSTARCKAALLCWPRRMGALMRGHGILGLLARRGQDLSLLLHRPCLLLHRPRLLLHWLVLLLHRSRLLLRGAGRRPMLALPPSWLRIGKSRDSGKDKQDCRSECELHRIGLVLIALPQQLSRHRANPSKFRDLQRGGPATTRLARPR